MASDGGAASPPLRRAAVVGDDSMGTTLAHVIASGGVPCGLWCRDAETAEAVRRDRRHPARAQYALSAGIEPTASLGEVVRDAALVIVAVPSGRFRATAGRLGGLVGPEQALFSSTKGIELETMSLMSSLLREAVPGSPVGAVTGLNLTHEIMAGQLSAVVVASPCPAARALAARALETPRLRVEASDDLRSAELAAVLKNVVAVAIGIAAGRELGFNARGLIFARGLAEIEALGAALGADPAAFRGIGGAGDLFLTASSPQSLNRALGVGLGRGKTLAGVLEALPEVPEGIGAVRACRRFARSTGLSLPLCEVTAGILEGEERAGALERVLTTLPSRAVQ